MEETSKDVINKFLGMFGHPEWNVDTFWNNRLIHQIVLPIWEQRIYEVFYESIVGIYFT